MRRKESNQTKKKQLLNTNVVIMVLQLIIRTNRVVRVRRIRISIRIRKGIATPYWNMYAIGVDRLQKNFDLSIANTV